MRKICHLVIVCCCVCLLNGCDLRLDVEQDNVCIEGSRNLTSEKRNVQEFNQINIYGDVQVYLIQGETHGVEVFAEDNIMRRVETETAGQTLNIDVRGCIQRYRTILVYVTAPNLRTINVSDKARVISEDQIITRELDISSSGSGDVDLWVEATSLKVRNTGSGDILLTGITDFQDIMLRGSGDCDASNLYSDVSRIQTDSSGNAYAYVRNALHAIITGSGNIYYKGSPRKVDSQITGSGSLIKQ